MLLPDKANEISNKLNFYIHTNPLLFKLDKTYFLERVFYKRHLLFGTLIVACSAYSFYRLYAIEDVVARMPLVINLVISEILYSSMGLLFMLLLVFSFVIGLIILFRPSLLKTIEAKANKWVDTSQVYEKLEKQRKIEQQQPLKWPRTYGFIICFLSMFTIVQCLD